MRRLIPFFMLIILAGALVFSVAAQDGVITIGASLTGQLDEAGAQASYQFEAQAGDLLVISLASNDFDARLSVTDAAGREIATNDDGGQQTNALIADLEIPATGRYTIVAASFADAGSGQFSLTLARRSSQAIGYGSRVSGSLTPALPAARYVFSAAAGDFVSAQLIVDAGDSFMELVSPDGFTVALSAVVGPNRARIGPFAVEQSGEFQLRVRAAAGYTLALDRITPLETTLNTPVNANFTPETAAAFVAYEAQAGQIIDLNSSGGLPLRLAVIDPFGVVIAASRTSAPDPSLSAVQIEQTGLHYIEMAPSPGFTDVEGDASLTIIESVLPTLDTGVLDVNFDLNNSRSLSTFEGRAGETVRIIVVFRDAQTSAAPYVEIRQGTTTLATVNLSGVRRLTFEIDIPADGPVIALIENFTEATYTIALERMTP